MPEQIVLDPECEAMTQLSRSSRWRLERAGQFPRRRQLSTRRVGWLRGEIEQWVRSRPVGGGAAPNDGNT